MRLPYSKIYRAFPELDKYSDDVCEQYVLRARAKSAAAVGLPLLLLLIVDPLMLVEYVRLVTGCSVPMFVQRSDLLSALVQAILVAGGVMVFFFPAMLVRDITLRRAIARLLRDTGCPSCGYQLIGLPIRDGLARCPECGQLADIKALGLTAVDLVAPIEDGQGST